MRNKYDPLGIIREKGIPPTNVIIDVALISLLIDKGLISGEELSARMAEISKETAKTDPYRS